VQELANDDYWGEEDPAYAIGIALGIYSRWSGRMMMDCPLGTGLSGSEKGLFCVKHVLGVFGA
jgi:hypothetical protein